MHGTRPERVPQNTPFHFSFCLFPLFFLPFFLFRFFSVFPFVCLSQAFCCEGSELILLIVLPGRNLDLNLLGNLVPDIPLGQYQSLGFGHQVQVCLWKSFWRSSWRKSFWRPSLVENWEELVGLTWLLSLLQSLLLSSQTPPFQLLVLAPTARWSSPPRYNTNAL